MICRCCGRDLPEKYFWELPVISRWNKICKLCSFTQKIQGVSMVSIMSLFLHRTYKQGVLVSKQCAMCEKEYPVDKFLGASSYDGYSHFCVKCSPVYKDVYIFDEEGNKVGKVCPGCGGEYSLSYFSGSRCKRCKTHGVKDFEAEEISAIRREIEEERRRDGLEDF